LPQLQPPVEPPPQAPPAQLQEPVLSQGLHAPQLLAEAVRLQPQLLQSATGPS
jgi:hypothetical protein